MPGTPVSESDKKLWAAYGTNLMSEVMRSGKLGDNDRFYIAPLSAAGIAAGKNINEPIKNQGVYQVADTLLDLNTPVFMPTRKSYFDRALLYVNSVELFADSGTGAAMRYSNLQAASQKAEAEYLEARKTAFAAWNAEKTAKSIDESLGLDEYCAMYFKNLAVLEQAAAGAAQTSASEAASVRGPNANLVGTYLSNLQLAKKPNDSPGFTMKCSPRSANQIAADQKDNTAGGFYSPAYDISSQYSADVDNWIATYAQKIRDDKLTRIAFSIKSSEKSDFSKLGFDSTKVQVEGSYALFFKVTFTHENKTVTKEISSSEAGAELEVEVTATGFGIYKVDPSQKWNPSSLFGMPLVRNADPSLREDVAFVSQVVMGYGVGVSLKMSSKLHTEIHDYLEKARTTGGSASFFGYNIGLGPVLDTNNSSTTTFDDVKSDGTGGTINIPGADNGYPTLLAVIGTKLPTAPAPKPA